MQYPRLDRAVRLAVEFHAEQEREGASPLPYITHPMEVLNALRYEGQETDEDLLCAAALHDVIEESSASLNDLAQEIGERAAALIGELTRREPSAEEQEGLDKEALWKLRANMLLDEIRRMSPEAQKIKLADRLSNVRDARRLKTGQKLDRYLWQTQEILKIVPRERSRGLWDAVQKEVEKALRKGKNR